MSLNGFVTLLTSTNYLPGVLVTINALKDLEASNPNSVPFQTAIRALRRNFDLVVGVEEIVSGNEAELRLLGRPDLFSTLTKLHLWRLIQFRRLIYLDADTLPLRPLSHLFLSSSIPDNVPFSACPDSGWPDCFNSGFFVFKPDEPTWRGLMRLKEERGSWDGGDQGILNEYFREGGEGGPWNRLSFGYNVTPSAYYS
ncbi:glycosyltransferase family 8 protein [Atractiella rhizophila]|nr:glycosyltransferase family 8 protein [Atractiella rhizophila]